MDFTFQVLFNKSFPNLRSQRNFPTFSSSNYIVLSFTFRSLISEIHLGMWYYDKINLIFLHIMNLFFQWHLLQNPFFQQTCVPLSYYIHFQSIYESVLELSILFHWSICLFLHTHDTFYYYGFVVCLNICQRLLSHFLFFFKTGLL